MDRRPRPSLQDWADLFHQLRPILINGLWAYYVNSLRMIINRWLLIDCSNGLGNQSPPSPTQSTDSLYSSSVGPSASATCRSPVPSLASKTTTFSHDRPFQRSTPARASYGGIARSRATPLSTDPQPRLTEYQPFQRLSARSVSLR